jgi:hypothetical protein
MTNTIKLFAIAGIGALTAIAAPASAQVVPGDTFTFSVTGFDTTGTNGFFLTPVETATFGATTTYSGAGVNGQDITISSMQTLGVGTFTNTFTVSTPTSFITTAMLNGTTITEIEFDLGIFNGGANAVNTLLPISAYTANGTSLYSTNSTIALTPSTQLSADNTSYGFAEAVNSGTTAISGFNVRRFTYSITYANAATAAVPEPATWGMMILGFGVMGAVMRRRVRASEIRFNAKIKSISEGVTA